MNEKELFENNCFPMNWLEDEEQFETPTLASSTSERKDLSTLLAELEDIKNKISDITAKEWHLAKLMKFHKAGFTTTTH